jgi:membrane-associated protein
MDPATLLHHFGSGAVWAVAAVEFIETGLLFPLLPGDTLLFTAGVFTADNIITMPIGLVVTITGIAAILGPQSGYWIGRLAGPKIFARRDGRIFKKANVNKTHAFFEKYGGRAIVLGQFVPFVRTYIPVAAGVGKMPYRHFAMFNVVAAMTWGVGVPLLGFSIGSVAFVRDHLEIAAGLVLFVSLLPIIVEWIRHKLEQRRDAKTAA